jgi:LAO/AO transport system kinase
MKHSKKGHRESALHVKEGTTPSNPLNPELGKHLHRQARPGVETLSEGILRGDRVLLSQAITLIESRHARHQEQAQEIIERCLPHSGNSIRIGITGVPGVGKSTFIEAFGKMLIQQSLRVAVLAIDPSSQLTKGSILGDKTRMVELASLPAAFIRPSPSGHSSGGVARKTRETIILCEAAGFDVILVETVGVGQAEIAVHSMVDFFLLLLLPGAGDELQGIKRGVVEMADLLAVNKSDGENLLRAKQAQAEYRNALHLFPPKENGWTPAVQLCSAMAGEGIPQIWEKILEHKGLTERNGSFTSKRQNQARYWMHETVLEHLKALFYDHPGIKSWLPALEEAVVKGRLSPFQAAENLMARFLDEKS